MTLLLLFLLFALLFVPLVETLWEPIWHRWIYRDPEPGRRIRLLFTRKISALAVSAGLSVLLILKILYAPISHSL